MSESTAAWTARAEAEFFRTLSAFVEPLIMAGYRSPAFWPTGMIIVETTGAKSGRPRQVPLLATILDVYEWVGVLSR
jgi:hypothetical protein